MPRLWSAPTAPATDAAPMTPGADVAPMDPTAPGGLATMGLRTSSSGATMGSSVGAT